MKKRILHNNNIMLTVILVLVFSIFFVNGFNYVFAKEKTHYEKSFKTIEIQQGDTLTSIAEEYAIVDSSYTRYIEEVKEINNLKDDTIHTGCYLLVPVYSISN